MGGNTHLPQLRAVRVALVGVVRADVVDVGLGSHLAPQDRDLVAGDHLRDVAVGIAEIAEDPGAADPAAIPWNVVVPLAAER